MKIEIKKTIETIETVEVEFPLYRKQDNTYVGIIYYCIISENKYFEVCDCDRIKTIKSLTLGIKDIVMHEEINEAEFIEAYKRVQNELTIEFHNQFSSKIIK